MRRIVLLAVAAGIALAAAPVGRASAEAVLKFGGVLPPKNRIVTDALQPWMRAVEKDSGGALTVQEFWGGQLVRSPAKQLEAVLNGLQDASFISAAYTQHLFPEVSIVAYPYIVRDGIEASYVLWRLYEKGMLSGFNRLYLPAVFTNDHAGVHLRTHIDSIEGLHGLKIRISGPDEAEILKVLGATPVAMRINAGAEAIHRGVVDGTFNAWAATDAFRMTQLMKSWVDEPLGVRPLMVIVSKAAYEKLPAAARKAMDKNSGLGFTMKIAHVLDEEGAKVRREARADPDANVIQLSDAQRARMAARFKPLIQAWIDKTPNGQKVYDTVQALLAAYRKTH